MNRLKRYSIVVMTNLTLIFIVRITPLTFRMDCSQLDQEDLLPCYRTRGQSELPSESNSTLQWPSPIPTEKYLVLDHSVALVPNAPVIYLITPTWQRQTQKADLTALCHTLKHIQSLVWIVVENSASRSPVIQALLRRCGVPAVHLTVESPERVRTTRKYAPKVMGVLHRNTGLRWVRDHCSRESCDGVVYFGDDDDKYDLRFFDEIRKTEIVSVFMVGLTGGLLMEGPYCENGRVTHWHRVWMPERPVPVDMQGFAVNVRALLEHRDVLMEEGGAYTDMGYVEASRFILQFAPNISTLECRSQINEVLVWRSRTIQSPLWNEKYEKSDTSIEL